jgi:hypothetical protein
VNPEFIFFKSASHQILSHVLLTPTPLPGERAKKLIIWFFLLFSPGRRGRGMRF